MLAITFKPVGHDWTGTLWLESETRRRCQKQGKLTLGKCSV